MIDLLLAILILVMIVQVGLCLEVFYLRRQVHHLERLIGMERLFERSGKQHD